MSSISFPKDFIWGTATASYQVEGAYDEDGRGRSIWDTFCRTPGKVAHGHTGDTACDQYHRYQEDVRLMHELGISSYRFSIAWPRIFPDGSGTQNPVGFDYYSRLVDSLLEAGIRPVPTLYHWDLPQKLEDAGGWPIRDTAERFAEYVEKCFRALGDRVDMWITLNEPLCSAYLGYLMGIHAPGIEDRAAAYRAVHHLNLAHGLALKAFRQGGFDGRIGTTLNLSLPRPATSREEDIIAADRAADGPTRMFLDPLYGRGYPQRHLDAYPEIELPILTGDMELISEPIDFLGINYYTERPVRFDYDAPEQFTQVPTYHPKTHMDWDIVPAGLFRLLTWVHENYDGPDLYVTENGCAYPDVLTEDGRRCHDPDRIEYLRGHLGACASAIAKGVNLKGYYLWSFIDNFEWAFGYTRRFGIVFCDYQDCRRIPKDSYYYYREVIAGHESFPEAGT